MRFVTQLIEVGIECWKIACLGNKPTATRAVFRTVRHASINATDSSFCISNQLTTVPAATKSADFIRLYGVATDQTKPTSTLLPANRIAVNQCRLNTVIAVIHHLALDLLHRGIFEEIAYRLFGFDIQLTMRFIHFLCHHGRGNFVVVDSH